MVLDLLEDDPPVAYKPRAQNDDSHQFVFALGWCIVLAFVVLALVHIFGAHH